MGRETENWEMDTKLLYTGGGDKKNRMGVILEYDSRGNRALPSGTAEELCRDT